MKLRILTCSAILLLASGLRAAPPPATVRVDSSQVPELQEWCNTASEELIAWYPRIRNLLAGAGFTPPSEIVLIVKKSHEGAAETDGATITVYSGWVSKHPEDVGMVIHELVHVIQNYPSAEPSWVTEGVADYIRWAIYEGKPLDWFPVPQEPLGYTRGYRATAGFFLWLESGPAPGIVRRLNTVMRKRAYDDRSFVVFAAQPLSDLWQEYLAARRR